MPRKALQIQVELDIQAVSCPGVWLCPNGKVSLQVYMLDSCIQTAALNPLFPLLYHEKFMFCKSFYKAYKLSDLQRCINKDFLYAELIQWQNCDVGNVLATFQTSLTDVLYPATYEGVIAGVDVDLLMEPSKNFPGIIAPKIEISTRTTVEEIVCWSDQKKCNSYVVNPKTIPSDQQPPNVYKRNQLHQQKVCHSQGFHKTRRCTTRTKKSNKPPFVCRKADEDLISRKPQGLESGSTKKCKCCCLRSQTSSTVLDKKVDFSGTRSPSDRTYTKLSEDYSKPSSKPTKIRNKCAQQAKYFKESQMCSCGSGHAQENCPVCSRYRCYFEDGSCACISPKKMVRCDHIPTHDSCVRRITTSSPTREHSRQSRRSPIRILGKEHHKSSVHKPHGQECACQSSRATSQESKLCDCLCSSNDCCIKKVCSPRRQLSLAQQIHRRLKKTLDCEPVCTVYGDKISRNESPVDCSCPKFQNCTDGFYKNLEKFYRDLRRC